MSRLGWALVAAWLLAACGFPGNLSGRTFTTGFKAGQTIRYNAHVTVAGTLLAGSSTAPVSSDQKLAETLTVKSVDHSGVATVEVRTGDAAQAATGAAASAKPATFQVGGDGRIRSGGGAALGGPLPSLPGTDQLTPIYAAKAVRPGDSWTVSYSRPNPYGKGSIDFTATSRYLRDEPVSGRPAAVIESKLSGPVHFSVDAASIKPGQSGIVDYSGNVTSTTDYWVDVSSGEVLKLAGTGQFVIAYTVSQAGVAGPVQVAFNGTVKTDLTRS